MHKFWYHSPLRFYKTKEELSDMTNPQNCQFFGAKNPYPLEKGELHRFLIPNHTNEVVTTNLKLFLVGDIEQEIQSLMTIIDSKLCAVTFRCDDFIQGHFEIRDEYDTLFYSNCVKFIDSTDSEGRKFIRIATKHNYDKNLFPYSKSSNLYCVTNLPAYDLGRFTTEIDVKNNRVGKSASLISSETYTDETVQYEFKAYGDANILSFIQVHAVNNEFYINGTQRTAIDKMEIDEFAMMGKLKFTNVKDSLGLNKTINESDIFNDLELKIVEFTPVNGYTDAHDSYSGLIKFRFNSEVYSVGDNTKAVYLYRVESGAPDSILVAKGPLDLIVEGDTVIFNVGSLPPGEFYMIIDDNLFKNSFGNIFEGISSKTEWAFTMTGLPITPEISISWEDGTDTNLSGILTNITLKIESQISSPSNPIIGYSWERSVDGINYTQFAVGTADQNVTLNTVDNFFRLKITLQDTTEIYSNVLKYTKETTPTTNYYFKATRPYNHPGNDFVRYIDQYGNEQTEVLIRSHWEGFGGDGSIDFGIWIEAPCMLIQANRILETQGALSCTP